MLDCVYGFALMTLGCVAPPCIDPIALETLGGCVTTCGAGVARMTLSGERSCVKIWLDGVTLMTLPGCAPEAPLPPILGKIGGDAPIVGEGYTVE